MINRIIFILSVLLLSNYSIAQEDQIIVDGGVGIWNSGKSTLSETKMFSLGVQEDLWGALKERGTTGFWLDNAGGGKRGSAFASGQLGWEVSTGGIVGGIFSGPAVISTPDTLLGGRFQFMDDIHLGLQDNELNYIGIMYRHFSSAGIETPNIGRDLMGLEIRFPL
jgi:hypothetical protein